MTIIETAKMNGRDPQTCLPDVPDRIRDHKNNRFDERSCREGGGDLKVA